MTKITHQEILNIARISNMEIQEHELDVMVKQLEQVLSYAERVKEIASDAQEPSNKNVNVFRQDNPQADLSESILERAPEREGNYFVVPLILEGGESQENTGG